MVEATLAQEFLDLVLGDLGLVGGFLLGGLARRLHQGCPALADVVRIGCWPVVCMTICCSCPISASIF